MTLSNVKGKDSIEPVENFFLVFEQNPPLIMLIIVYKDKKDIILKTKKALFFHNMELRWLSFFQLTDLTIDVGLYIVNSL